MTWTCEDCGFEGYPKWAQREVEHLQSFYEEPYCPECGSYCIYEDDDSLEPTIIGDDNE